MLNQLITHVNNKIDSLNLFDRIHGLCHQIVNDGKTFPAEYCKGEYKQVSDFDKNKGTVYHRLTGNVSTSELEDESVSYDPFYRRSFPVRTVAVIKKKLLPIDNDAYIESRVAQDFLGVIASTNNKILRSALGVDSVAFEVTNIITDRDRIFSDEYKGIDNFFRYEFLYIVIDYNIHISGPVTCFDTICQETMIRDNSDDY